MTDARRVRLITRANESTAIRDFPAGGGTDAVARLFAPRLAEKWKQPVVVENRTGAEGSIGAAHLAKSAPDGHTLLLPVSSLAINAHVFPKLPHDTQTAFAPITPLAFPIAVMVGSPKLPVKDARGFLDAARAASSGMLAL